MATVPIQFEPALDSSLTYSQNLSHVRKDRSVGACGAVYSAGAVAACPAFDRRKAKSRFLVFSMLLSGKLVRWLLPLPTFLLASRPAHA
jgi:hypothetical protein